MGNGVPDLFLLDVQCSPEKFHKRVNNIQTRSIVFDFEDYGIFILHNTR